MGRVSVVEKRPVKYNKRYFAKLAMDLKLKWERNVQAAWRRWNDE